MSRPRLVPGKHHDPSEPWAREPRLPTVVELRSRRMSQEQYDRRVRELMIFAAGAIVGIFGTVLW